MRVNIFELKGVPSKRALLQELFEKSLFPGVTVMREEFPPDPGGRDQGWRYLKLLQAAIPPEQGISLGLDEFSYSIYRVYIKAYFSMSGSYFGNTRGFSGSDLLQFFPAVAVHDRMVLVPLGLRRSLVRSNEEFPAFPALKAGGVLELDFDDENALRTAVRMVSERLNADFLKELQAYRSFQDLNSLSLQALADDLNADLGYLQHLLKGDEHIFDRASYNDFEWTITPEELPVNRWTKVTLGLRNNSDQNVEKLLVQIRGPVKVSPERIELTVAAHSSADTLVAIKPEESGDYPLEVAGVLPQDKPLASFIQAKPVWVKFT
jgi:hypothetical protein